MENLLRFGIMALTLVLLYYVYQQSCMGEGYAEVGGPEPNPFSEKIDMQVPQRAMEGPSYDVQAGVRPNAEEKSQLYDYNYQVLPYPQISTNPSDSYFMAGASCSPSDPGCYSGSVLQAPDLLPRDVAGGDQWMSSSPSSSANISDQNFLESAQLAGINTVGSSLRNANLSLRSDPPIPKVMIGPWQNSTIDSDTNRKGFEVEA
jgi:hypothetical protein